MNKLTVSGFSVMAVAGVILCLQIAGVPFAKLYSVEALILALSFLLVLRLLLRSELYFERAVQLYFLLGVLYLFVSIALHRPILMLVRQYALFFYSLIGIVLMAFLSQNKRTVELAYRSIVSLAYLGAGIEVIHAIYTLMNGSYFHLKYRYASPTSLLCTFIAFSYLLVSHRTVLKKYLLVFLGGYVLSVGHSSAVVVLAGVVSFYWMIRKWFSGKVILAAASLPVLLVAIPASPLSQVDMNVLWRYRYWGTVIKEWVLDYFVVFGHGFGVPYLTGDIAQRLIRPISGAARFTSEVYKIPPHNSWLTILFHAGLPALILVLEPVLRIFRRLRGDSAPVSGTKEQVVVLFLSLAAISLWASFNVVLEVPYGAICFWFVYAVLVMKYRELVTKEPVHAAA